MQRTIYLYLYLLFQLLFICQTNGNLCSAKVSVNKKSSNAARVLESAPQLWEITVQNTGLCPIQTFFGSFDIHGDGHIMHAWNYDLASGEVAGFRKNISVGATYRGAGFIVTGTGVPSVSHINPKCVPACSFPTRTTELAGIKMWPISIVPWQPPPQLFPIYLFFYLFIFVCSQIFGNI